MPLLNSVTTPYAEALLQVVSENDQTEVMVEEVKQLPVSYTHLTLPTIYSV